MRSTLILGLAFLALLASLGREARSVPTGRTAARLPYTHSTLPVSSGDLLQAPISSQPFVWEQRDAAIAPYTHVTGFVADAEGWWLGSYDATGLWHSRDEGGTWEAVGAFAGPLYDLARGADGTRWAATAGGVWRGTPEGWQRAATLPAGVALDVAVDGATLYVVFSPAALWRLDAGRAEQLPLPAEAETPLTGALGVAARGDWLLLGSSGAGGWQSHDGGGSWERLPFNRQGFVPELYLLSEREGWLRAHEGLWHTGDGGETWVRLRIPEPLALRVDAAGIFVGVRRGLVMGSQDGRRWTRTGTGLNPQLPVVGLWRDTEGNLVAGMQDGLWRLEADQWQRRGAVGTRAISALVRLSDGTLLAGHRDGLYRSTDDGRGWELVPLQGAATVALTADPQNPRAAWAGTDGRGVWRTEDSGTTWQPLEAGEPKLPFVNGLLAEPSGRLLARAAFERVYEWEAASRRWEPRWEGLTLATELFSLAADGATRGRVWAGATDGLFRMEPGSQRWERVALTLQDEAVGVLHPDPAEPGTLWIGATRGLYRLRDDQVEPTTLLGRTISALAWEPGSGRWFAGSRFHGLFSSPDGIRWKPVPSVAQRSVTALVPAPGGLWVATDDGLGWLPTTGTFPTPETPVVPASAPSTAAEAPTDATGQSRAAPLPEEPRTGPRLYAHLLNPSERLIRAAAAEGYAGIVLLFPWRNVEPNPDEWHWEETDLWVEAAEFYGLELIVRLDQSPWWVTETRRAGTINPLPDNWADYTDYVIQIAQRYRGRIRGYQLWNEPNLALDWGGLPPDPIGYLEMLRATVPTLRAADPAVLIAAGALAPTTRNDAVALDDLVYLDALLAAGGSEWFDVLAVHPYPFGLPPDAPPEANSGLVLARLGAVREVLARHGLSNLPLWATEFGYSVAPGPIGAAVTMEARATLLQAALHLFPTLYPEVETLTLWNLSRDLKEGDEKEGYNLLQDRAARAVVRAATGGTGTAPLPERWERPPVALAADVRIHLGDSELPPPWMPLLGAVQPSTAWEGGFFLAQVPEEPQVLLVEIFQPNEWGNTLSLNGTRLHIGPLPVADFTGQWLTLRLTVPPEQLRVGWNRLIAHSGPLLPDFQQRTYVWDDIMLRNVRLVEQ